jgi:hypothetical protein
MVYMDLKLCPDEHVNYLRGRKRFPILRGATSEVDVKYLELLSLQMEQNLESHKQKPGWISVETWKCIQLRNFESHKQASESKVWQKSQLKHHIHHLLKLDRMRQMDEVAELIEKVMAGKDSKMGFQVLQKWYKRKSGMRMPMSHQQLSKVSDEWMELYRSKTMSKPEASLALNFEVRDEPLLMTKSDKRERK